MLLKSVGYRRWFGQDEWEKKSGNESRARNDFSWRATDTRENLAGGESQDSRVRGQDVKDNMGVHKCIQGG